MDSLEETPFQGVSLGGGVYKTRMQITSKGKGKSGGARVLNYVVKKVEPHKVSITFLSIFDKNEMEKAHPINQGENSLILYKICTFAP